MFDPFIESRHGDPAITWITETAPLGTGGAIVNALAALGDEPFFALNGDILTDLDLTAMLAFHRERGAAATIALHHVEDARAFGLVLTERRRAGAWSSARSPRMAIPGDINAGTYLLDPAIARGMDGGRARLDRTRGLPGGDRRGTRRVRVPLGRLLARSGDARASTSQAHFDLFEGKVRGVSYPAPWIDPTADVDVRAHLGRWVAVGPGAVIGAERAGRRLGDPPGRRRGGRGAHRGVGPRAGVPGGIGGDPDGMRSGGRVLGGRRRGPRRRTGAGRHGGGRGVASRVRPDPMCYGAASDRGTLPCDASVHSRSSWPSRRPSSPRPPRARMTPSRSTAAAGDTGSVCPSGGRTGWRPRGGRRPRSSPTSTAARRSTKSAGHPGDIRIALASAEDVMHLTAAAGPVRLSVRKPVGGTLVGKIPDGETWVVRSVDGAYQVHDATGAVVGGKTWGSATSDLFATYADHGARVTVPEGGATYNRGTLEFNLTTCTNGCSLRLILQLPFEEYLLGIGEVPSSWPVEALRAQAIAARSFALYKLRKYGLQPTCNCDLTDGSNDQVYIGWDKEGGLDGERWVKAVRSTAGSIVTYHGAVALTVFTASDGGHTEDLNVQWGTPLSEFPYLAGVCDPGEYTAANPWTDWSRRFTMSALTSSLAPYTGDIGAVSGFGNDRSRGLREDRGCRRARGRRGRLHHRERAPIGALAARRPRVDQRRQERGRRHPLEVRLADVRTGPSHVHVEAACRRSPADVPDGRDLSQRRARRHGVAEGAGLRGVPGRGRRSGAARPARRGSARTSGSSAASHCPDGCSRADVRARAASTGRRASGRSRCGGTCSSFYLDQDGATGSLGFPTSRVQVHDNGSALGDVRARHDHVRQRRDVPDVLSAAPRARPSSPRRASLRARCWCTRTLR